MIATLLVGAACLVVGYYFGDVMGHANSGYHDERPFASFTWRNYTHHYWHNLVYRLRPKHRKLDKIG